MTKENEKRVPKLRFKGFTDDWEQRKFGNFIEEYVEKTTSQNQYPVLTSSQQVGIVLQEDYFSNRQVTTSKNIGYFVLPKGYFTYRSRSDNGVFVFNRNDSIDKGIISYFYPVFRVINADSDFFLRRINFGVGHQIAIAAEGTGQHVLSLKKFKDIRAMFPVIQEQVKIGNLFSQLDIIITLHQRKLEQLEKLKQALLQQMFSQKDETVPKLRFANFDDEWEQHKLGDSVRFINGRAYRQAELLDKGKYRVLRVGNFNTNTSWYYSNLELEDDKYANKGDLLYLWATSFGPEIWERERVIYHYHIWKVEMLDENIDKQYLYTWLETDKERIKQMTNGTTMVHVTKGLIEERSFQFPIYKQEQRQIGALFKNLDNLITLHQKKLEHLKLIKQSLLQNLFI
ncbi:type I restriction enzyme, S subunit [Aerococcus sp. 150760007-1]|uniref:Restriction endonuclease subunit S n=1 Tax=Aerococcus urinaeequi TaxID=51665 RepID=A0ABR6A034_9LACT|nr:restriction endonuclease subunit S [Aerococcus urinaeequi]MBA5747334.1 restriction endonuclease subunit S [Aerococcus urinaeequi]MBA5861021.1 restriction endonuclease subunit S [Aerococcus urinaeequi]